MIKRTTLSNFIKNRSNEFALAGVRGVIENPGKAYNPLWIYGPSSCGKSHLLKAIRGACKKKLQVRLFSAEELAGEVLEHIKHPVHPWPLTEEIDILLVDNLESLIGREAMQEEFRKISLQLLKQGKQVVFASSCAPAALPVLYEHMYEEWSCSLIADIQQAERDLKRESAEEFLKENPFDITDAALALIVKKASGVSSLQGAMKTARFVSVSYGETIDVEWVRRYWRRKRK